MNQIETCPSLDKLFFFLDQFTIESVALDPALMVTTVQIAQTFPERTSQLPETKKTS